tara:strand:- start:1226 stop:1450 length:225 start_codon:yes stop_codon:yes gene_type:complete
MTEKEQLDAHKQLDMFEECVGGYSLMKGGSIHISGMMIMDCNATIEHLFCKELQAIPDAPEMDDPAYDWRSYIQ